LLRICGGVVWYLNKPTMKRITLIVFVLALWNANAQKRDYLFGVCTRDSLMKQPHAGWFVRGYESYKPDDAVVDKLKKLAIKDYSFEVYFGSWCGDSRRDVPRFYKLADKMNVPAANIKLIAVGLEDQYKQAPGGETNGKGIYRVATFVVLKQGKEVNRITEHAVNTLEHDLFEIMSANSYQSNYKAYPTINLWLQNGVLQSDNISTRGYAKQLTVFTPGELNTCAHVLLVQGKVKESVAIYRMNAFLFYDNPDAYVGLAKALSKNGNHQEAVEIIEYAFQLNNDKSQLNSLLQTYYDVKKAAEVKPE
jgi:thiol-disulfide isomerase/thioredoxin